MSPRNEARIASRIGLLAAAHVALVVSSYVVAVLLRFEFSLPSREQSVLVQALPVLVACRLIFFARYHLFRGWWQYVGVRDVVDILKATTAGSLAFMLVIVVSGRFPGFPRSLVLLEWALTLQLVAGVRVVSRLVRSLEHRIRIGRGTRRNVLLIGTGPAAESALRELAENPSERRPIGFLDDGSAGSIERLHGLPRLGRWTDLRRVLGEESVSEVFIALPPEQHEEVRQIVRTCRGAGASFRVLPSTRDHLDRPRPWDLGSLTELLDPEDTAVDDRTARELFYQKTVLLLGAGGQMGRALAWAVANAQPAHLLLFDRNESPLYYLEVEFLKRAQIVPLSPLIGDLRDLPRLRQIFSSYRPDVVIHAAAYTRPDLLSENREEYVENNLRATEGLMLVCNEIPPARLLLLSCDETLEDALTCLHLAGERFLESAASPGMTRVAVRFPSVLGSPGCLVTRAAAALQERTTMTLPTLDPRVPVVTAESIAALLLEALALGGDGEILAIEAEPRRPLSGIVRYLQQVWNLPAVPLRVVSSPLGHRHPRPSNEATAHPRIFRRTPQGTVCPYPGEDPTPATDPATKGEDPLEDSRRG